MNVEFAKAFFPFTKGKEVDDEKEGPRTKPLNAGYFAKWFHFVMEVWGGMCLRRGRMAKDSGYLCKTALKWCEM